MGIDEAIARASEHEENSRNDRNELALFRAKRQRIIDGLYLNFVKRLQRAGVEPQKVFTSRQRGFFMRWLNGGS